MRTKKYTIYMYMYINTITKNIYINLNNVESFYKVVSNIKIIYIYLYIYIFQIYKMNIYYINLVCRNIIQYTFIIIQVICNT